MGVFNSGLGKPTFRVYALFRTQYGGDIESCNATTRGPDTDECDKSEQQN